MAFPITRSYIARHAFATDRRVCLRASLESPIIASSRDATNARSAPFETPVESLPVIVPGGSLQLLNVVEYCSVRHLSSRGSPATGCVELILLAAQR
jgi:hypothetical protein